MNDEIGMKDIVQQVQKRDQKRAEFVATVGHDLKTPLNGIIGFSSLLLQDTPGLDSECLRQLNLIYTSARSLLERIDNLLDLFRMESGKITAGADWVIVSELAKQLIEPFEKKALDQGIKLEINLARAPGRIRTDSKLISRVLKQFITNALKFTRQGSVQLAIMSNPKLDDRIRVRFTVSDTGMGIRPEELTRITASLDPATNIFDRSYQSIGLGLALALQASNLLGGVIRIESHVDQGSAFALEIDLASGDVVDLVR